MAKQVVANVLIEIVTTGYLSEAEAIDIADMLCYKNAERLFAPREEAYQN